MTGKLEGLVIPVMEPLGYPHEWAGQAAMHILDAVPVDCGAVELNSTVHSVVLTCGGLWRDRDELAPTA